MKLIHKLAACFLPALLIIFTNPAWVAAAPVITLERARELAQSQGEAIQQLELSSEQASLSLDMLRRQFGLGAVGVADSKTLKEDMDTVESLIDERLAAIKLLDENIAAWQEQQDGLAGDDPEAAEPEEESLDAAALDKLIRDAYERKAEYQQQVDDLRPAYVNMVLRYHPTKAQEDQASPQLQPAEAAVDATADALLTQPRVIDYNVDNLYLSLLGLAAQLEHQENTLANLQQMVRVEQLMLELGMSTALRLASAETAVHQMEAGIKNLQNSENDLRASFRRLLGLPMDFSFTLNGAELDEPKPEIEAITLPDLTQSIRYQRALSNLQLKIDDLEDTSRSDTRKYRQAELAVEEAEFNLETTLKDLQTAYESSLNALLLAQKALQNARLGLENAREALAHAELKYRLGTIAAMALEQKELEQGEAALQYQTAFDQYYLSYQAYRLAREGISVNAAPGR